MEHRNVGESDNGGQSKSRREEEDAQAQAPSAFDFLSRGASQEEARRLRKQVAEWAAGEENSFPVLLALLTRAQWRAAASIPAETAKMLERHRNTAQDAAQRIAQAAEAKLVEFELLGKLAPQLKSYVEGFIIQGDEALKRMREVTADFLQAEKRANAASKKNDALFLFVTLLVVALLGFGLGFLTCHCLR